MRGKQTLYAILCLVVLMFMMSGCGLLKNAQVTGTVVYDDGTPAANVDVQLGSHTTKTDAAGAFSFEKVRYNSYEFTVSGPGQARSIQQVEVKEKEILLSATLQVVPAGNILTNPDFADAHLAMPPTDWNYYGKLEDGNTITLANAADPAKRAIHISDVSTVNTLGFWRSVAGEAGKTYRLTVNIKALPEQTTDGFNIQLRFNPVDDRHNILANTTNTTDFEDISLEALAPAGTTSVAVYLWTSAGKTPQLLLRQASLVQVD